MNGSPRPTDRDESAAAQGQDSVTTDAIREGVAIPPMELPQDQRRAYLGGAFTRRRGGGLDHNPYIDPGCAEAWRRGFVEASDA